MLHFVKRDHHIPKESIDAVQASNPEELVRRGSRLQLQRSGELQSYNAEAAKLAKKRSLKFVKKHLGRFFYDLFFFWRESTKTAMSVSPERKKFKKSKPWQLHVSQILRSTR
jgi:hypothetical protein